MSVDISPHTQLGFPRPLTQVVKKSLYVTNSNSQPVAFKVKTTAPKQYCVRPNSGRIEPGDRVEVQVLLQPLKEEPAANAKCRDKFLIQSAVISPEKGSLSINEFWAQQEGNKDLISEHKIRCAFLPPSSEPLQEEAEGDFDQTAQSNDLSRVGMGAGVVSGGAPTTGYGSSAGISPATGFSMGTPSYFSSMPRGLPSHSGAEPPISISSLNTTGSQVRTVPSTSSAPTAPAATNENSGAQRLPATPADLEAEVRRLRAQLAESKGNSGLVGTAKSTGVPVHIVAAIAVAVFAVTYLFF